MKFFARIALATLSAFFLLTACAAVVPPPAPSVPATHVTYESLPLTFEANQGQAPTSVQFVTHGAGYNLQLSQGEAILAVHPVVAPSKADQKDAPSRSPNDSSSVIHIALVGANTRPSATARDLQVTRSNYFLGNDPSLWRTDIPNYAKVRYHSVYDGVDLIYYGNQGRLEHDFVVAPGADPTRIVLRIDSQDSHAANLRVDPASGDLLLNLGGSQLRLLKPITYQTIHRHRYPVTSSYKLLAGNQVRFEIGRYHHDSPLIIDPILTYSTYFGGSGSTAGGDVANAIALDLYGNTYLVGTTASENFPVTSTALQSQNYAALTGHGSTVFISRLNGNGTAIQYSTYLGGSAQSFGYGIAVDSHLNTYVTGATYSSDFPVTCTAIQPTNPSATAGATTGFVAKLNEAGALVYSTYLGGKGNQGSPALGDVPQAIAVNAAGNAYVTGYTWSADFPVTTNAFQKTFAGTTTSSNAFVTEINPAGTAFVYSTYLGGNGSSGSGDAANAVALDKSDDAFVTGSTTSPNFPVTGTALQPNLKGAANAFVTELDPTGKSELYSSYLGGSANDSARAIALDASGFVYIGGVSSSSDFPLTSGVLEGTSIETNPYFIEWGLSSFVSKLNLGNSKTAPALEYSTYLEGAGTSLTGIAVDSKGSVYATGTTNIVGAGALGGFQSTPDALAAPKGLHSAFLVKLNPLATALNFATLLGGSGSDAANAIAIDSSGNAYITGSATSIDFPTTAGVIQTTNRAKASKTSNAFVSMFALGPVENQTAYPTASFTIPTSITNDTGSVSQVCNPNDPTSDTLSLVVSFNLATSAYGPPPTGTIYFGDDLNYNGLSVNMLSVSGSWGNGGSYSVFDELTSDAPLTPIPVSWSISYTGDGVYGPANASGTVNSPGCPAPATIASSKPQRAHVQFHITPSTTLMPGRSFALGPKFLPPPAVNQSMNQSATGTSQTVQPQLSCRSTLTPLTVTLRNTWRTYGAANPAFAYTLTGLIDGDTVEVTPYTTAAAQSPVGTYPITALIGGAAASNYNVTIKEGTLSIFKALLHIQAQTVNTTYGQTPPALRGYHLIGFVNGDTASAVSGAPVLTTTVTATTPVGFYKIDVEVGTLTAANYSFSTISNGYGAVGVYKAPLKVTANNLTMTQGGSVPALTYTITGFVNAETASGVVTGAPVLTTTVTSSSKVGRYPISITAGTLAAHNYYFAPVPGVLTVSP